jgi:peptide/nickel transport system ATP-binding protein
MSKVSEQATILEVIDLSLAVKRDSHWITIIKNISFTINKGETLGLVGESGSGKSLTAQAIMRLLPQPNIKVINGDILFKGTSLLSLNSRQLNQIRGNKIAMIFQEPMTALNPVMTIGAQIFEQIKIHNSALNKQTIQEQVIGLLTDVGIDLPKQRYKNYPHQLSGGMRQRVMIAMALSCKPELIIADEPTTALDVSLQAQVLSLLKTLQQKYNASLIFISHDLAVVAQVCQKALILYAGEIIERGDIKDIFNHPHHPYSQALLLCTPSQQQAPRTPLPSIPTSQILNESPKDRIERFNNILEDFASQKSALNEAGRQPFKRKLSNEIVLKTYNLSKKYSLPKPLFSLKNRYIEAVKNISLSVNIGQTLGIVGTSGSGKSTFAKVICGIEKADSGKIELFQHPFDVTDRKSLATNIQYIFQDPQEALNNRHTVAQLLVEPLIIHKIGDAAAQKKAAIDVLELVGLNASYLTRYTHELSGGQKQRIGIARALMLKPKLLICDEPVSALDVSVQAQILNLLIDLQNKLNLSMIFITHDLYVVRHIADNIAVMHHGEVVEYGSAESICDNPQESYTQQLIAATPTWPLANNALA